MKNKSAASMLNIIEEKIRIPIAIAMQCERLIKEQVRTQGDSWKLNDRKNYLNTVHERNKKLCAKTQMQYEELDEKHQNDLAMREDSLKKVKTTRDITKILFECSENFDVVQYQELEEGKKITENFRKVEQNILEEVRETDQCEEDHKKSVQEVETKKTKLQCDNKEMAADIEKKRRSMSSNLEMIQQNEHNLRKRMEARKQRDQELIESNALLKSQCEQKSQQVLILRQELTKAKQTKSTEIADKRAVADKYENMIEDNKHKKEALSTALINQENFTETVLKKTQDMLEELTKVESKALRAKTEREEKLTKANALKIKCEELESKIAEDSRQIREREEVIKQLNDTIKSTQDQKDALNECITAIDSKRTIQSEQFEREKNDIMTELEELKRHDDVINACMKEVDEENDVLQNKLTNLEQIMEPKAKNLTEQLSELNESIELINKETVEISVKEKQRDGDLKNINEQINVLKEAEKKYLIDKEAKLNDLLIATKKQEQVENNYNGAIKELENFTIGIAQVSEKINSVRKNIETKSSICTDQLDAWAQEKATLLMERQQLNNEILKSSKLAEDNEAIAQQLTSTLEDQICKERSYNERGLTNIKKRLSDFQKQASANVNHISNLSSELNQVKEARTKSEATKENLIRELETRQTELQAIEDVIISKNKEKRIQNEALDKQIKNNLKNSDKIFADNVKIKKKLRSLGARSKSKNSLKEKKSKKLVVNDPQSGVWGSFTTNFLLRSDAESQIKSPRLLIKKDKKQVEFALPEIASPRRSHAPPPAPPRAPFPRKPIWDFGDSSDGDSSDGDIAAQKEPPTKEHPLLQASQLPPPPPPHRQNKFFSSRQPKRYKPSADKKY